MTASEKAIVLTKPRNQLTEQTLSLIPGLMSEGLDFFRDNCPLLRHTEVLHDFNCPRVEDLQTLNSRSSLGRFAILYLSNTVHTYAVPSGELSREIKNVLECCCETSAQIIEGLNGIANGWDGCCKPFSNLVTKQISLAHHKSERPSLRAAGQLSLGRVLTRSLVLSRSLRKEARDCAIVH